MDGTPKHTGLSLKGVERDENKDDALVVELGDHTLFVVFDGVSSTPDARAVIDVAERHIRAHADPNLPLGELFWGAQQAVMDARIRDGSSTYVALLFDAKRGTVTISHLGDSRIYGIEACTFTRLTNDDNDHDDPHFITKALGFPDMKESDLYEKVLEEVFPSFLLATDGFFEFITNDSIKSMVCTHSEPERIRKAIEGKNPDDATYLLIQT